MSLGDASAHKLFDQNGGFFVGYVKVHGRQMRET
jgi:hypothetical protein